MLSSFQNVGIMLEKIKKVILLDNLLKKPTTIQSGQCLFSIGLPYLKKQNFGQCMNTFHETVYMRYHILSH